MNLCHCDWFTKEADWLVAVQGKISRENQTKDTGKKKGGVRGVTSETQRKQEEQDKREVIPRDDVD